MKYNRLVLSLGLATSLLSTSAIFAGDKMQEEQAKDATSKAGSMKPDEKIRKFTGVILEHKVVNVFPSKDAEKKAQEGEKAEPANKTLVTLVKTDKGNERLIVDLGAVENVPDIKDGETKLKAEGRLIKVGDRQLFVANKAQVGEKVLEISRQKG